MAMEPQLKAHVVPNPIRGLGPERVCARARIPATVRQHVTDRSLLSRCHDRASLIAPWL